MYKKLKKEDFIKALKLPEDYKVDGVFVVGTFPKNKEYIFLYEALKNLKINYTEEKIDHPFFSEIKSLIINNKRIWFDVVYGGTYLSELLHTASLFGSKANILLGTCGSLKESLNTGDIIIPEYSYGNESSVRMYQRNNSDYIYKSNDKLNLLIKSFLKDRKNIYGGKMMTVQAMLAETSEDIEFWSKENYSAVDMESSVLFAISNHFNVPSTAVLSIADNLVKNVLTTDENFNLSKSKRDLIKRENYEAIIRFFEQVDFNTCNLF